MMRLRIAKRMEAKRSTFIKTLGGTACGIKVITYPTPQCQEWMRRRQCETTVIDFFVSMGGHY